MKKICCLIGVIFLIGTNFSVMAREEDDSDMSFDFGLSRNRNVNLWPVYKYSISEDTTTLRIDALFSLFRYHRNTKTTFKHAHLLPFFWNSKSSIDHDFRFLSLYYPSLIRTYKDSDRGLFSFKLLEIAPNINLLGIDKTADGLFVDNKILFFIWYKNNQLQNKAHFVIFPFYYWYKNPDKSNSTLFPLYSSGSYNNGLNKYKAITPLFWRFSNQQGYRNMLFPLWWSGKCILKESKKSYNVVFPFYWSIRNNDKNNKVLFPFIWNLKNNDSHSFSIVPLFSKGESTDKQKSHLVLTPLYWNLRNGKNYHKLLLPLWSQRFHKTEYEEKYHNIIFPFYWTIKDSAKDNNVIFPISWKMKNNHYQSYSFLPLFSKGASPNGQKSHSMLTPLYWRLKDSTETKTLIIPFLKHKSNRFGHRTVFSLLWWKGKYKNGADEKSHHVIFPLYWAIKDTTKNNHIIFPFVWHLKNKNYSSLTLFPLGSIGSSGDKSRSHFNIYPLYWSQKEGNNNSAQLFPVWWYKSNRRGNNPYYSNIILPFFWSRHNKERSNQTLFPIYSRGTYNQGKSSYCAITPLFWRLKNNNQTKTLLPLFLHSSNPFGYKNVLLPIWWNGRFKTENTEKYHNVLFPIYWSFKHNENQKRVLFPFVWNYQSQYYSSFSVLPLFSKGKSIDEKRSHLTITPLFWRFKDDSSTKNLLLPIWYHTVTKDSMNYKCRNTIFPLYWSSKNNSTNNKILFPFVWSLKNNDRQSFSFWPFYSKGESANKQKSHFALTPFFWNLKKGKNDNKFLIPLWWQRHHDYQYDVDDHNIVFPVYWSFNNSERKTKTVFPLYSHRSFHDYEDQYTAITPLYWHFKNASSEKKLLLPVWWNARNRTKGNETYRNIVFPFYWSYHDKKSNNKTLFPIVWSRQNAQYKSFTLAPLFSKGYSPKSNNRHLMLTPLFWDIKKSGTHHVNLFPIFKYYKDRNNDYRYNLLYALLRFDKKADQSLTSLVWPIISHTRDIDYNYFRIAPIVWYKNSKNSDYFSIQPLFYHSNNDDYRFFSLLWQLYTYKNYYSFKKSRNILWKTIGWDKYENNDHEFRILYFLFADVNKEGKIEREMFPFYRYTKEDNGNKSISFLFHFYQSFKQKIPGTDEYYKEHKIFWFFRFLSNEEKLRKKLKKEGKLENFKK